MKLEFKDLADAQTTLRALARKWNMKPNEAALRAWNYCLQNLKGDEVEIKSELRELHERIDEILRYML